MRSREELAMATWEEQVIQFRRDVEAGIVSPGEVDERRVELDSVAQLAVEDRLDDLQPLRDRPYPDVAAGFVDGFAQKVFEERRT